MNKFCHYSALNLYKAAATQELPATYVCQYHQMVSSLFW
jgi:hypothetical protein